jgi:hypothetical protein
MKRQIYSILTLSLSFVLISSLASCLKGPGLSIIPAIEYRGISKDTITQSIGTGDSFILNLHIEDGDGDIGDEANFNLFILDSRTGADYDQPYLIPLIPESITKKGVIIDLELRLFATCCIYPDSSIPCTPSTNFPFNELELEIYLVDRAGNVSNTVISDTIYLKCE